MSKKKRKKYKRMRLKNKKLIKKYPWLAPKDPWTGKPLKHYSYWNTYLNNMPRGWRIAFGDMLLEDIDQELKENHIPAHRYHIQQIKEKYGSLRWYASPALDCINKYEYISQNICMRCGRPDSSITNTYWIHCECEDCYNKYNRSNEPYEEAFNTDDEYTIIPDTYSVKHYSKDGDKIITYDISDTVKKIRDNWYKKHRK